MSYLGVAPDQQVPLYRTEFISAEQTITVGGLLTIPHGLGVAPSDLRCFIRCKTAGQGYSVGDELQVAMDLDDWAALARGIAVVPDATNITIRYGNGSSPTFTILDKSSGIVTGAPNANWRLVVRAWAEPAPVYPETGLGSGQTWQDMSASRTWSTNYTNTTGKPIIVNVAVINTAAAAQWIRLYIGGVLIDAGGAYAGGQVKSVSCVVPAGETYQVTRSAGAVYYWNELR